MRKKFYFCFFVLFVISATVSCSRNMDNETCDNDEFESFTCDNPICSILYNTTVEDRLEKVVNFLMSNPEFVNNSDSVGYWGYGDSRMILWMDCGGIRVYSVPFADIHYYYSIYVIQQKESGKIIDTMALSDNDGLLESLHCVKDLNGKMYYVLSSSLTVAHQGTHVREYITAFSIDNGQVVEEKLFQSKNNKYSTIEVECGGEWQPIDYDALRLIFTEEMSDDEKTPAFVIAEINQNYWPTGNGLLYRWNGISFTYSGKCLYDANGAYYY